MASTGQMIMSLFRRLKVASLFLMEAFPERSSLTDIEYEMGPMAFISGSDCERPSWAT
jgi:hypothetical protein